MAGIITQARINSSRLPNKIFLEAGGVPFLLHHINRLRKSGIQIIVATVNDGSENAIIEFCKVNDLPCFRGDENNVLERFHQCALHYDLKTVIRVTSDCPLIDGAVVAEGLAAYTALENENIYYSNAIERTYPRGMDYEIFSFKLLDEAYKNATSASDLEHVTPYIWNNRAGNVHLMHDKAPTDNAHFRLTLDTSEDRELLTTLIEQYAAHELSCNEICNLMLQNPRLASINGNIEQKKVS